MKIILAGIGVDEGDISLAAYEAATSGKKVFLRTALSKAGKYVLERGIKAVPLDDEYGRARNFDTLSKNLAKRILDAAKTEDVVYLVDGDVSEDRSCNIVLRKAKDVKVISGVTKASKCAATLGLNNYTAISAYDAEDADISLPVIITDVDDKYTASKVKLALADKFGDDIPAYKFINGTYKKIRLYEADYGDEFDYSTALAICKLDFLGKQRHDFDDLHEIVKALRAENGCPWDRAQTKESVLTNAVEEVYEMIDAVKNDDEEGMCEEVGDVLLQAVFQIVFAEERGAFTLNDTLSGICGKLISRHTHVFARDKAENAENALEIWNKNKAIEKKYADASEYVDAVPASLPALMRAQKVGSRAAKSNFDFENVEQIKDKIYEELNEIDAEIKSDDKEKIAMECGDLLFAAVNLARKLGLNAEECLGMSTDKFQARFKALVNAVLKDGKTLSELDQRQLDAYYDEIKKH